MAQTVASVLAGWGELTIRPLSHSVKYHGQVILR
jgi:hypothetical protein